MDIDGPVANKDAEDPSVSHDSSPVATMDNDNAVATRDTNDSSMTTVALCYQRQWWPISNPWQSVANQQYMVIIILLLI